MHHTGYGGRGARNEVGKVMADTVSLTVKDDFFAVGGGDNPLTTGLVADGEAVVLQLGEGEKIGNAITHEP